MKIGVPWSTVSTFSRSQKSHGVRTPGIQCGEDPPDAHLHDAIVVGMEAFLVQPTRAANRQSTTAELYPIYDDACLDLQDLEVSDGGKRGVRSVGPALARRVALLFGTRDEAVSLC